METYITHICNFCSKEFKVRKKDNSASKKSKKRYCSRDCSNNAMKNKVKLNCLNCNVIFYKYPNQYKKRKNHFCSKSCAASYNNKHKTKGTRRSKLEIWLEQQLTKQYSDLEILYNNNKIIGSELDIYIPKLKLAFELNGIFHYEPIYGDKKLNQIQNNDSNKFELCQEQNISLCIIDTSKQIYFKEKTSKKYFNIICEIINKSKNLLIS